MKITNILLTVAVAGSLAACEKTDTANPGDATPDSPSMDMDAPAADPMDDDMGGDDMMGGDDDLGGEEAGDDADEGAEE